LKKGDFSVICGGVAKKIDPKGDANAFAAQVATKLQASLVCHATQCHACIAVDVNAQNCVAFDCNHTIADMTLLLLVWWCSDTLRPPTLLL
jgi:hypothetical protein